MKIVQSLWSKPLLKDKLANSINWNKGGWTDQKHNYMSWALSALQFRKFYEDVELVTDELGYKLLIEKLQLPYSKVNVVLNNIDGYHKDLWALGKIYTYSIQDTPFIHADGDVYIWERFPLELEKGDLIGQNIEMFPQYYTDPYRKMKANLKFIPNLIQTAMDNKAEFKSMNAGVIGGCNIKFIKEYAKMAFEFIDHNYDELDKVEIHWLNFFFEQVLFYALAKERNITIKYLLSNINYAYDGCLEFAEVPKKIKFVHALGRAKKDPAIGFHIEKRLFLDHPRYHKLIMNLLHTYQI